MWRLSAEVTSATKPHGSGCKMRSHPFNTCCYWFEPSLALMANMSPSKPSQLVLTILLDTGLCVIGLLLRPVVTSLLWNFCCCPSLLRGAWPSSAVPWPQERAVLSSLSFHPCMEQSLNLLPHTGT